MAYIKLEDVLEVLNKRNMTKNIAIDEIKNIPTADVVEVVRCKDCKYGDNGVCVHPENITHSYDCDDNVYDYYIYVSPYHFCSYGERKNDFKEEIKKVQSETNASFLL